MLLSRPDPPGPGRLHFLLADSKMADSIPMTRAGAEAIKRELKRLKSVDRPKNVHDISVAREHGDLRENAEYHAAKERQSHIDGRIKMLEDRLARAQIIDVSKLSGERVVFGRIADTSSSEGVGWKQIVLGIARYAIERERVEEDFRRVAKEPRIITPGHEAPGS